MPQLFMGGPLEPETLESPTQNVPVDENGQPLAQLIPPEERPRPPRRVPVSLDLLSDTQSETKFNDDAAFPNAVDPKVFDPVFFKTPSDPELPLSWSAFVARLVTFYGSKSGQNKTVTRELASFAPKSTLQKVFSPSRMSVTSMVTQYCELKSMYDTIFQIYKYDDDNDSRDIVNIVKDLIGYTVPNTRRVSANVTEPPDIKKDAITKGKELLENFRHYYQTLKSSLRLNEARDRGSTVHQFLEEQADAASNTVVPTVEIASTATEEVWAVKLLRMAMKAHALARTGRTRELYVFGEYQGMFITGIIDELKVTAGGVVITDTKTRWGPTLPSWSQQRNAYHQVLIYHRLLTRLAQPDSTFDALYRATGADPDAALPWSVVAPFASTSTAGGLREIAAIIAGGEPGFPVVTLRSVEAWVRTAVRGALARGIADRVQVQYVRRVKSSPQPQEIATVAYRADATRTEQMLEFAAAYWLGKRAPLGVAAGEADAKCTGCAWARVCAWRKAVTAMTV